MNAYIGCVGLLGIALFIALLFVRRRKIENEMSGFYKENSLYVSENCPQNIRESLSDSENIYCCRTSLRNAKGKNIEFCWWEWFIKSTTMVNGMPSASFDYYLAVSFAPNVVSRKFTELAIRASDKSGDDFAKKAKDFFVLDTEAPYRAETLADDSLIICWRVLKRRDIYDAKINWLKNNLSAPE